MLKIFGLALLGAFLSFTVKAFGWKGAPLIALGAAIAMLSVVGAELGKISRIFDTISGVEGMKTTTETLLKVLFVGYVSGLSSEVCKELGEAGIASVVQLCARIEVLLIISPMLLEILTIGLEMVK